MKASLHTALGDAVRAALRPLGRGLGEVVSARDAPPQLRSHRARVATGISSWLGAAILVVVLVSATRAHRFGGGGLTTTNEEAELLSLLLLSIRFPLLAWRIGYLSVLLIPLISERPRLNLIVGALLVTYWLAGLRHGRAAAWAMVVLSLLPVWLWLSPDFERPALATVALLVIGVALDATLVSRSTGQELAAQVAQGELEEAQRALLEERTRIAREMHDVVAHHMSMIAVQAETARYRVGGLNAAATDEFAALSGAAREALTDLRRLLGVLRSDAPAERDPQPQLGDVGALVEATRRAGVAVELSMPKHGRAAVTPAVGLCAYRVVQEALSNASRHAPGAPVTIAVMRDPGALRLDVVNGPPMASSNVSSAGGRPGHGIAGMSERVTILGGSISAAPRPDGGFAVSATLPLVEAGE